MLSNGVIFNGTTNFGRIEANYIENVNLYAINLTSASHNNITGNWMVNIGSGMLISATNISQRWNIYDGLINTYLDIGAAPGTNATWAILSQMTAWVSGSGTLDDPYIMAGLRFRFSSLTIPVLSIKFSTDVFVIQNCIFESLNFRGTFGISLNQSWNGIIYNCYFENFQYAILANSAMYHAVFDSTFATIGSAAILWNDSWYFELSGNNFQNNVPFDYIGTGIGSHWIYSNNRVDDKPLYYFANQKGLNANMMVNPGYIFIYNCSDSLIEGLESVNMRYMALIIESRNLTIKSALFRDFKQIGIAILYSENITIDTSVFQQTISYSEPIIGLYLSDSSQITIKASTFSRLDIGIYALRTENLNCIQNTILLSFSSGINMVQTVYSSVINNYFQNNSFGILMQNASNHNILDSNQFQSENQYAIWILSSSNATLTANSLYYCFIYLSGTEIASHSISTTNTVNGYPIRYYNNQIGGFIQNMGYIGQLILTESSSITIRNNTITNALILNCHLISIENNTFPGSISRALVFVNSNNSFIRYNTIQLSQIGMNFMLNSHNNQMEHNTLRNNIYAIIIEGISNGNVLYNNTITENSIYGIYISGGTSNRIYYNMIHSNTHHAFDQNSNNSWHFNGLGNVWGGFIGQDANKDGICDTFYQIQSQIGTAYDQFPIYFSPVVFNLLLVHQFSLDQEMKITFEIFDPTTFNPIINVFINGTIYQSNLPWSGTYAEFNTIFTGIAPGTYIVQFQLRDGCGSNISYSTTLIITNDLPQIQFLSNTSLMIYQMGGNIVNLSWRIFDNFMQNPRYSIYLNESIVAQNLTFNIADTINISLNNLPVGTHSIRVLVDDGYNAFSSQLITVYILNDRPSIVFLTNQTGEIVMNTTQTITLKWKITDSIGKNPKYSISIGSQILLPAQDLESSEIEFVLSNLTVGVYYLTILVDDGLGEQKTNTVKITVIEIPVKEPILDLSKPEGITLIAVGVLTIITLLSLAMLKTVTNKISKLEGVPEKR
jgi:parallel beta-helix repeat protein